MPPATHNNASHHHCACWSPVTPVANQYVLAQTGPPVHHTHSGTLATTNSVTREYPTLTAAHMHTTGCTGAHKRCSCMVGCEGVVEETRVSMQSNAVLVQWGF